MEKNPEKAFYWTQRAALHGDRDAQYNLGWFYETGTSVPQDMEQAVHWYQLAAQQREKEALDRLCL